MPFTPVTITHDFDLPNGAGALGVVEFTPADDLHNGGQSVPATPIRKALDVAGGLSQTLPATTDPGTTPPGVPYRIVVRITGQPTRVYYAPIPHNQGSSLDLATVLAWGSSGGGGGGGGGGGVSAKPVALVNELGVLTPDATKGYGPHRADITSDTALAAPTGGTDGQPLEVQIYAAGGDRVLTLPDALVPVTITAGVTWWGRLSYVQSRDQWLLDESGTVGGSGGVVVVAPGGGSTGGTTGGSSAATGPAGGVLAGAYPNPEFAVPMASRAEMGAALTAFAPNVSPTFIGTVTAPRVVSPVQTVPYAPTIGVDASTGSLFRCFATGNVAVDEFDGGIDGQTVKLQVKAVGADRSLTLAGATNPITVPAGAWWTGTFDFIAPDSLWQFVDSVTSAATSGGSPGTATVDAGLLDTDTIAA